MKKQKKHKTLINGSTLITRQMKVTRLIPIAFIGFIIVCSCANNDKYNDIHVVKVTAKSSSEKKQKSQEQGDIITIPPYDITVDMEFMDTTSAINSLACKNINNFIIREFLNIQNEQDGQKAVATFIQRLQNHYEQEEMAPEIYDHLTGKAEFGREGVLNYTLYEDFYGGGAHPTAVTNIVCFNTETGNKINLYDVFTDTCTHSLCDVLTDRLMKDVGATSLDSLHSLGYLEMLDMFVSENFTLAKDSIHFFYNQYDIAPYSVGTTTLSFSYEELKNYLR